MKYIPKTKEQQQIENLQRLKKLRPLDDDLMRQLFKNDPLLAQTVLRIVTRKNDLTVIEVKTQHDMKRLSGSRGVCLDALAVDSEGQLYDLEIQRDSQRAKPRRARYHSSAMDIENLDAGEDFDKLPNTYVIFITEYDIFGKNKEYYRIERINLDANEPFDDGEHILYINGAYEGDSEIGRLMHDFRCSDPNEMYN